MAGDIPFVSLYGDIQIAGLLGIGFAGGGSGFRAADCMDCAENTIKEESGNGRIASRTKDWF